MVNGWSAFAGDPFSGSGDEDTNLRYAGPAWDGATPIMPYNQGTYIELSSGDDPVITLDAFPSALAQIPDLVQITDNGTTLTITLNEGLYYSSVKTGSQVDNNFKYFIYYNVLTAGTNTITLNKLEAGKTYVGLKVIQNEIFQDEDPSLEPINKSILGTGRIQIMFSEAMYQVADNASEITSFEPVFVIDHINKKIKYLNNLTIANII